MMNRFLQSLRGSSGMTKLFWLFAIEGALLQFTGSINGFGNNIFATNLGATDAQIGLIQTIPNIVAMALMLPLGVLSDKARSSRTMPLIILSLMAVGYLLMGMVPMAAGIKIPLFFFALAFTAGGPALYGAQWQTFFGDVFPGKARNGVLTLRNRFMFFVGIAAPIICGVLMGMRADAQGKLIVLQVFFFLCAAITLLQVFVVSRVPAPERASKVKASFSLKELGGTISALSRNKGFMLFFVPVVLFYMSWQFDWSMWYIGQTQYLFMNETALSIYNGVFNVGQLVAVGILSKVVYRKNPDYALSFAALGLLTCPAGMALCTVFPVAMRGVALTVFMTIFNAPQCAINLCVVQILLRVSPVEKRTMAVSLFTLTTTLTNAIMPYLGVKLYTACGADYRAMLIFTLVTFLFRAFTLGLLLWRYRKLRLAGELDGLSIVENA